MKLKKLISILAVIVCALFIKTSYAHSVTFKTSPIQENKLRITLDYNDDNKAKGVSIAYYYLKNGKTLNIGYEIKEKALRKAYIDFDLSTAIPPIRILLTNINDASSSVFPDIAGSSNIEYIQHLHDAGIIKGREDGRFDPYGIVTRAEFITILVRALRLDGETITDVPDVHDIKGHWAEKYIKIALKHKFITGYEDGTVKPEKNITIAEGCSIITKVFDFKTLNNGIYDKLRYDEWYSKAVKEIFDVGVLKTTDSIYKNFKEESFISRENTAMILSRAMCTY